jgi:uncharacterized Zn-binding protein involved in type VI secretion
MRRLGLLLAPLALAACAGRPHAGADPRVSVKLTAPSDAKVLRADTVQVQGMVSPGDAEVRVNGRPAAVNGGAFVAQVALRPGANVIDVTASAPGRRADADAIRVTRDMRVEIPQLLGDDRDAAVAQLRSLGLDPQEKRGGGFLDRIIPGSLQVCEIEPPAGTLVNPHTRVTVIVARTC